MSLQTFIEYRLSELGYKDTHVEYSLGNCQGDGVAFYGGLCGVELRALAMRIMARSGGTLFRVLQAINAGASILIERNSYGHRYSHQNTMDVRGECTWDQDGVREATEEAFEQFVEATRKDVKHVSRNLEAVGYKIVDSVASGPEIMREIRTGKFLLQISHEYDSETLDFAEAAELEDLATGKYGIALVKATLYELDQDGDSDQELSSAYRGGVMFCGKNDRYLREMWRDAAREVIAEARGQYPKPAKVAQKLAA